MRAQVFLFWVLGCLAILPFAKGQKRTITSTEFLRLATRPGADTLRLDGIKIIRSEEEILDPHIIPDVLFPLLYPKDQSLDTLHIYKSIDLRNVELDWNYTFRKVRFHREFWLENCDNNGLLFTGCRFDSAVYITSQSKTSNLSIKKCRLQGEVDLIGVLRCDVRESSMYDRWTLRGEISSILLGGSVFHISKARPAQGWAGPHSLSLRELTSSGVSLEIFQSSFTGVPGCGGIDLFSLNFDYFNLQGSRFEVPVQAYLALMNRCIIEKSEFLAPIDCREIGLPTGNTNIPFYQISKKIVVKNNFLSNYGKGPDFYQAVNDAELKDHSNYNELIAVYAKLLAAYRYRGDQESYNACYIEMKDIASRKARFDYQQNPTLEAFFEWRLNQFLKTFCDYGTSPVKSLLFSMYVILAFAGLYFLFPSEDDRLSKSRFQRFLLKALHYFQTDSSLMHLQSQKRLKALSDLEELRQRLEEARKQTPPVLQWIGRPFYAWMRFYQGSLQWLYKRSDLVQGEWKSLKPGQKTWLGFWVGVYFAGYLLVGLLVRLLNALALSLNVFVTLGYGEISASGTMRYLAVLEGLIGWFLLSIFSVSLIGQVLQ